jgi:hypothetical protein
VGIGSAGLQPTSMTAARRIASQVKRWFFMMIAPFGYAFFRYTNKDGGDCSPVADTAGKFSACCGGAMLCPLFGLLTFGASCIAAPGFPVLPFPAICATLT